MVEYGAYADRIASALKLTEIKEFELTKFNIATLCVKAIRDYFKHYNGDTVKTDEEPMLLKAEIESIVTIFNHILGTNYWFDFPRD